MAGMLDRLLEDQDVMDFLDLGTDIEYSEERYQWTPEGFGNPPLGMWRRANGALVDITKMNSEHITNAIIHMFNMFGSQTAEWPIHKRLWNEQQKRKLNVRSEWDS